MGQALYRKYRSKALSEIVGQEHITTALKNALAKNNISHAYLFTGPRGVGKTSIARILAHAVNGLPYDETATHLDIIEIDAASNRRIDEIRELRERVHSAPTSAKYKVYIIDEVHMLTKEAFNALLKTLEEPPAHAIFILATTEAHKLPETIVSRTQRFTFKPIDETQAIAHLASIAKEEGIKISPEALELIVAHGQGSFRDSISLLDQASNTADTIELSDVQAMLGIAPERIIQELTDALSSGEANSLVATLKTIREHGYSAVTVAKQLAGALRTSLLDGTNTFERARTIRLLERLLAVQASHDPETALELALFDVLIDPTEPPTTKAVEKPQPAPAKPAAPPKPKAKPEPTIPAPKEPPQPEAETPTPKQSTSDNLSETVWDIALQDIKKTHNTLYSLARMAQVSFEGDEITLAFGFPFHQKRMNEAKNKQIILDVLQRHITRPVTVLCILDKSGAKTKTTPTKSSNTIDTISNIFGSAEVLE